MTGRCEYLYPDLEAGGTAQCPRPSVVTVRVAPELYPGSADVVVGHFCEDHAARMVHHTTTQPNEQETRHA